MRSWERWERATSGCAWEARSPAVFLAEINFHEIIQQIIEINASKRWDIKSIVVVVEHVVREEVQFIQFIRP